MRVTTAVYICDWRACISHVFCRARGLLRAQEIWIARRRLLLSEVGKNEAIDVVEGNAWPPCLPCVDKHTPEAPDPFDSTPPMGRSKGDRTLAVCFPEVILGSDASP